MPHQYGNTIPSSISVSFPLRPGPLSLLPSFPHWHNSKNNARVPPHQTPTTEGERGSQRDRWRGRQRITVRVEMWLCIKAKLRGKNFLLNWLYIHEKRNHNVSLSMCCSPSLCLCLSHGANCLHATSVYFYTLLSKPFLRDQIQLSIRFFTCVFFSPLFGSTFRLLYTYWQHAVNQWHLSDYAFEWDD